METLLSAAALAAFGWIVTVLIPQARRQHEPFALACSVLATLVALIVLWLFAPAVR
jgi:hypothetical protein